MSVTINAYCTHRDPPPLEFPHTLNSRRDRSDPELPDHLNGFIGFIMDGGERQMTQSLYHVMRHIERVQHHFSLDVDEAQFEAFSEWAWRANAVCFLTDGTVRDPSARILVHSEDGSPEEGAEVPYPPDAHERKSRTEERLQEAGVHVPESLPPVVGEVEVHLRSAKEVAERALALFVAAIRAESLGSNEEIPVAELRERRPLAFEAMTPKETEFFQAASPEQQHIIDFAWRYEALAALQWAIGLVEELPWPTAICDVPRTARIMLDAEERELVASATLRPPAEILDALDLHYRLHWAVRQARLDEKDPPANLDPGVISERHHTLNWLVRFEDAEWDDVDTPT